MVVLVRNTRLYSAHDFDLSADPWSVFTSTNHHPAFIVSDQFLGMVGRANVADQRKSTAGINYQYSAHEIHRRKLVENSEMM